MASVLELIGRYQHVIEKYSNDEERVLQCIDKLFNLQVTVQHLQETGVGRTVNALRKEPGEVGKAARALVSKWKTMVAAEESDHEGDQKHDTSTHNGHGSRRDSDDHTQQSRTKYESPKRPTEKSNQMDYKEMNGHRSGSKRKSHSGVEEEPESKKKPSHSSSSERDYKKVVIKQEKLSESESNNDSDSSDSVDSDSYTSESSREVKVKQEIKKEIKEEKVSPERHRSSSTSKHLHSNHMDIKTESSLNRHELDKHSHHSSKSKESISQHSETLTKSSSHKNKSSLEKEKSSKKRDKHDSSGDMKESKSSSKHSSSDKHKPSSHKHESRSERIKTSPEKHSSKSEHRSSSHSEKHKSSTEKENSSKHKSKDSSKEKHSSSSKDKAKDRSSSSKERSSSHNSEKKSSSESKSNNSDGKSHKSDSKSHKSDSKSHNSDRKSNKSSSQHQNEEKSNEKKSSKEKLSSSSSHKNKSKEEIPKKKNKLNNNEDSDEGIDCSAGASFAEALGMISPAKAKKKSSQFKDINSPNSSFNNDLSPAALLAPTAKLAPLPAIEISALPEISPNYKVRPPPKLLPGFNDEDAISAGISSKNQRTKVYSGNKVIGKVTSLYEMCVHILQEHIDALEFTGGVPYEILKPVVDRATPQQLFNLEHYNPYLMEDTDHLWQKFCQKSFRNKQRHEMETWREMYMRCQEEQEHKLKSLTANIRMTQEAKKAPIKQTKMAYVDSVVKPPRNIARKQALHGTAHAATASPASRVASLSTTSNVLKGGMPRPPPAASVSASSFNKPKKAPLMQKALQFMRGRKR